MSHYNRTNPSPRYQELIAQYQYMHKNGVENISLSAENTFPGISLIPQAPRINTLIKLTGATTILDYGSGKGQQYDVKYIDENKVIHDSILDYWDVDELYCYDPCYEPNSKLPSESFSGVICTDVLEHCPEDDVYWIVDEIFSFAEKFVFANVASYPATKQLPNGENAHCTQKDHVWWNNLLKSISDKYPDIFWEVWVQEKAADKLRETRLSNFVTS